MEAVLLIGIQASGKSTFYAQRFFDTHVRVNLDMLKTRHREHVLLQACLAARLSFVVDNTNVTRADRARYVPLARAAGYRVVGYYFHTPLDIALARNRQRTGKQMIPDRGIVATFRRLELPALDEGFDDLLQVTPARSEGFAVRRWAVHKSPA